MLIILKEWSIPMYFRKLNNVFEHFCKSAKTFKNEYRYICFHNISLEFTSQKCQQKYEV